MEGDDYELSRDGGALLFRRELAQEGRLGFWRWFLGAWGIGTYRRNDVVDVRYQLDGRTLVAHGLGVDGRARRQSCGYRSVSPDDISHILVPIGTRITDLLLM